MNLNTPSSAETRAFGIVLQLVQTPLSPEQLTHCLTIGTSLITQLHDEPQEIIDRFRHCIDLLNQPETRDQGLLELTTQFSDYFAITIHPHLVGFDTSNSNQLGMNSETLASSPVQRAELTNYLISFISHRSSLGDSSVFELKPVLHRLIAMMADAEDRECQDLLFDTIVSINLGTTTDGITHLHLTSRDAHALIQKRLLAE